VAGTRRACGFLGSSLFLPNRFPIVYAGVIGLERARFCLFLKSQLLVKNAKGSQMQREEMRCVGLYACACRPPFIWHQLQQHALARAGTINLRHGIYTLKVQSFQYDL
jgi:hypothetical protein